MKRVVGIVGLILVVVLAGTYLWLLGNRHTITITQSQIDEALAKRFPVTKRHLLIFEVTYSEPKVRLLERENRIEVGLNAEVNLRIGKEPKRLGGSAVVRTGIRFDSETHEFFLAEPGITAFTIQGIPDEYSEKVTGFASRVAREYIEERPIYTLRATDLKKAAAKLLLKGFEVRDQRILVTLGL